MSTAPENLKLRATGTKAPGLPRYVGLETTENQRVLNYGRGFEHQGYHLGS